MRLLAAATTTTTTTTRTTTAAAIVMLLLLLQLAIYVAVAALYSGLASILTQYSSELHTVPHRCTAS